MPGRSSARGVGSGPDGTDGPDPRSTGDVIASLVINTQALIAKEIELLGLELKRIVTRKITALALLLVAALTAGSVLLLGAMTAALALEDRFAERWVAWGVVTLATLLVALVLLAAASRLLAHGWSPRSGRKDATTTRDWLQGLVGEMTGGESGTGPRSEDGR